MDLDTSKEQVRSQPEAPILSDEFRAIFAAEFEYVCRALRRLGVHERDATDVAQDLFVMLVHRLEEYDRRRPLRPWLFSFAARYAANYRRLARHRAVPDASEQLAVESSAATEARDLVLRALERLSFDHRLVVVMHDLEGFEAPELAAQLGIPVNTVYSRLRLARAQFRAKITELQQEHET